MAFAQLSDGVIVTINRTGIADAGQVAVPDSVMPGDLDNGDGTFSRPAPPAPTRAELYPPLPPWKFHAILALAGLDDDLERVLQSMDPIPQAVARAKLQRVLAYHRDDPLMDQLGAAIGKTPEQIDTLWTQAHALE